MPWFNRIDWEYVVNTRGDFAIVTDATIEAQREQIEGLLDGDPALVLPNGSKVYRLKKFIPTYYTGVPFTEDRDGVLDNGYFYSPNLLQEDLLSFDTNEASYFFAVIDSPEENDIAFTLYPNRYYKYYVDGTEVDPIVYDMQVFIPITAGTHQIKVIYTNTLNAISNGILIAYHLMIIAVFFWQIVLYYRIKKSK